MAERRSHAESTSGSLVPVLCGVLAILLGLLVRRSFEAGFGIDTMVDARVAECLAHEDGSPEFVRGILYRERWHTAGNLQTMLIAAGCGGLAVGLLRRSRRGRQHVGFPLAGWVGAALVVAVVELTIQLHLAIQGAREGLFTESEDARLLRAFDAAVEPARIVLRAVPADARIVVIDYPDSQVVKKFGYLVYPRRVYMPPRTDFRFSAAQVRDILWELPHGIDWCYDEGYTHLVDLQTLVNTGDPAAIIELRTLPR